MLRVRPEPPAPDEGRSEQEMTTTESLTARMDVAAERRERAEAELLRRDGARRYGEQEHRDRQRQIERDHGAVFDAIDADIARKVEEAEQGLFVAEHADPADALTTSEFQRANAKSQFVAADAQRLSLDKLAQRCRAAAASGDKASMFLWTHHAYARVGEPDATADETGADEVREAVAELRAKLDPDQERKLAEAREAVEETQALREHAYYRRRGVDDAFGLYPQQSYGNIAARVRGG